jgi:hypothetical protein
VTSTTAATTVIVVVVYCCIAMVVAMPMTMPMPVTMSGREDSANRQTRLQHLQSLRAEEATLKTRLDAIAENDPAQVSGDCDVNMLHNTYRQRAHIGSAWCMRWCIMA